MPKYFITAPRFIDGKFVDANVLTPAIVELPEGTKVDKGMALVDKGFEKPKQHFSDSANRPNKMASDVQSKPLTLTETHDAAKTEPKRASDKKVI